MLKSRVVQVIVLLALVLAAGVYALFNKDRAIPELDRAIPCKWDPALFAAADNTCDKQCSSLYKGAIANSDVINDKVWYFCCSRGYSVSAVKKDGKSVDAVCVKN